MRVRLGNVSQNNKTIKRELALSGVVKAIMEVMCN